MGIQPFPTPSDTNLNPAPSPVFHKNMVFPQDLTEIKSLGSDKV
jgi:hypothetical protein